MRALTPLAQLQKYLNVWNLKCPELIAQTKMCEVYRVQRLKKPVALKILNEIGKNFESSAPRVLKCYAGHGAVRILEDDEDAHLLEYIDGPMLEAIVKKGHEKEASHILCDVIEKLHGYIGSIPAGLHSMERNFRSLFVLCQNSNREERGANSINSIFFRGETVARRLIETEQDVRLLHGDLHDRNMLHHSERSWIAIDPQCLVGERTYEVANAFFNSPATDSALEPSGRIEMLCRIFSERLRLDPQRVLEYAFAYGCLNASWMRADGLDHAPVFRIAEAIEARLRLP